MASYQIPATCKPVDPSLTDEYIQQNFASYYFARTGEQGWFWLTPDWDDIGPFATEEISERNRMESGLYTIVYPDVKPGAVEKACPHRPQDLSYVYAPQGMAPNKDCFCKPCGKRWKLTQDYWQERWVYLEKCRVESLSKYAKREVLNPEWQGS
jgi:hypothetical protein